MKKITISMTMLFIALFSFAQQPLILSTESAPGSNKSSIENKSTTTIMDSWQTEFTFDARHNATAGTECDGTYIYNTVWSGTSVYQHDLDGTLVDSFEVMNGSEPVSGLRDLAYDGTYFYGGTSATMIYKMDFTTKQVVSTITTPEAVRHICYDPNNDAFWIGNWDTDWFLVSRSGTTLQAIAAATHGTSNIYGTAYDTITSGGPYIWAINADQKVVTSITQVSANTGIPTGLVHDCSDICELGELGGGLYIESIQGKNILGGVIQNMINFGYDMASLTSTSALENDKELSISTYPNPASSELHIRFNSIPAKNATIKIYNILGGVVYNEKISGTTESNAHKISVSNLTCGTYIISLTSNGKIYTNKINIE